jgi:predicted nucleic acid-binding protein
MAVYYGDSSAIVKRYARETGTAWIRGVAASDGNTIYTVRVTGPEVIAALFLKARTGQLAPVDAATAADEFRRHWRRQYRIVEIHAGLAATAMDIAQRRALRGYDAVHVAAAVSIEQERRSQGAPPLIFLSSDVRQLQAAAAEGLATDDPNLHP